MLDLLQEGALLYKVWHHFSAWNVKLAVRDWSLRFGATKFTLIDNYRQIFLIMNITYFHFLWKIPFYKPVERNQLASEHILSNNDCFEHWCKSCQAGS